MAGGCMSHIDLAEALFKAFANGDAATVRALCSTDLKAFQNLNPPVNLDALLAFAVAVKQLVPDFHYANARRTATPSGFIEEHTVSGTLPDGSKLKIAACVVADVSEGKISNLREYVDAAAAQGLLKALTALSDRTATAQSITHTSWTNQAGTQLNTGS